MNTLHKKAIMKEVGVLLTEHNHVVYKNVGKLLDSGAINTDNYAESVYTLPKILLTAVLQSSSEIFMPFDHEHRKEVENLKHF